MDAKKILTNKSFCPLPWTGFIVQQNGDVKNCVLSTTVLGNVNDTDIETIMTNKINRDIKQKMLDDKKPEGCSGCYKLEENKRNNFDIISQRKYYIKSLKDVAPSLYDNLDNFNLHKADLRWTNQCNQACVYCGPHNSSLWEKEVGPSKKINDQNKEKLKNYVITNCDKIKNLYLAGGEPTLMNENIPLLEELKKRNPKVNIRINTNLSNTNTKVCNLVKTFENVHWTVSVEATGDRYEYIRYGGNWKKFKENLIEIKNIKKHKISFNMLLCMLNYKEIFSCVDFLQRQGFHNNSFIIGPVYEPFWINVHNLKQNQIEWLKNKLKKEIEKSPGFLLEDSYKNLLRHVSENIKGNYNLSVSHLKVLDKRRLQSSDRIFQEVYD